MNDRERTLPVWARNKLRDLRHTIATQQALIHTYEARVVSLGSEIHMEIGLGERATLPKHCTIMMGTGRNEIKLSLVDGQVRAYSEGILRVLPRAANACYLENQR